MKLIQGDCLEVMKEFDDNSVDAIVTDPPYGLSFMGKRWDYDVPSVDIWKECLRVLKPGGYLLSFAGTRTQHRMAVRIEDAGFEIRDMIFWTYASGFPKSLNIWKQLKKRCTCGNMEAYEQDRNVQWVSNKQEAEYSMRPVSETNISETINPKEEQGKVLQQSLSEQGVSVSGKASSNGGGEEPCLERGSNLQESKGELQGSDIPEVSKGVSTNGEEGRIYNATQTGDGSTSEQTIGESGGSSSPRPQSQQQQYREPCAFCKQYGTQAMGALGLGSALKPACEPITVARKPISEKNLADNHLKCGTGGININGCRVGTDEVGARARSNSESGNTNMLGVNAQTDFQGAPTQGRFPANVIFDEFTGKMLDEQSGITQSKSGDPTRGTYNKAMFANSEFNKVGAEYDDIGGSSRFFYCPKADNFERNKGLKGFDETQKAGAEFRPNHQEKANLGLDGNPYGRWGKIKNHHPTVKPIDLMRYLVKLITPKKGIVLDPFMGSGTTGKMTLLNNRKFIGIEKDAGYFEIAKQRLGV